MTDEQFKILRSMQFAQLALLQSMEANLRHLAQQQKPPTAIGVSLARARELLDKVIAGRPGGAR